jgi:predicted DsbA family dithiol-disulfide isomerase
MHAMFFGFGEIICPECYNGEQQFIFLEEKYWLNRITARLLNQRSSSATKPKMENAISYQPYEISEIDIIQ